MGGGGIFGSIFVVHPLNMYAYNHGHGRPNHGRVYTLLHHLAVTLVAVPPQHDRRTIPSQATAVPPSVGRETLRTMRSVRCGQLAIALSQCNRCDLVAASRCSYVIALSPADRCTLSTNCKLCKPQNHLLLNDQHGIFDHIVQ